ncbi:MAG TPA: 3-phosphoshikimate 1-carboxyvinyltransferase [Puia sp.]|nr:3-phosphoshikimate 1-carboxyvinyltransferase [Puia sp.]
MNVTIIPSEIKGSLQVPSSKSSMQRACAAALISQTKARIFNPGHSNDDLAALRVIRALGANIENLSDGSLLIESKGMKPVNEFVNCGESGLGIRMFAPLVAMSPERITIEGEGSLLNRPMNFFDEVLPKLGVEVRSNMGKLPIQIKGPLIPSNIQIDGSLSSQFLTGLLMAYSASDAKNINIEVRNLKSRPYIDLTLSVMCAFGLKVPVNKNYNTFYFSSETWVKPSGPIEYNVEGDWSGAAFLLVAAAIAGKAEFRGLDPGSTQADKAILMALQDTGISMSIRNDEIQIGDGHQKKLMPFHFDATDCPDLFPPLVALASACHGSSFIKGIGRLAHKESDRALTLQEEFGKMGVEILINEDVMGIRGTEELKSATVHSRHDHRIAMATAVAALRAAGPVQIEKADAINKSYPDFFKDLKSLGVSVHLLDKIF